MRRSLGVITTAVALAGFAGAQTTTGPFGFERGMTKAEIIKLVGPGEMAANNPNALIVSTAPKANAHFEKYIVFISPTQGLLKVKAVGKDIETGDQGTELHTEFDSISTGVSQKYGTAQTYDTCDPDTIGCSGASVWMLGLHEKNRILKAFWNPGGTPVNHVTAISLEAVALGLNKGYCMLAYEFEGWDAYVDAKQANDNKSF